MRSLVLSLITFALTSLVALADRTLYVHLSESEIGVKLKELLNQRNYKEAVEAADVAIEKNPSNHIYYHQRSVANLAQGKTSQVLSDLDKIVQIKPDFEYAYNTRASILLKQGSFAQAESDYKKLLSLSPSNQEAKEKLDITLKTAEMVKKVDSLISISNWQMAIEELSRVFEVAPASPSLRLKRAECYEKIGDYDMALADYKRATNLKPDSAPIYMKAAKIHYFKGDIDASLEELKNCLHIDPEEKQCFAYRKTVKEAKTMLTKANEFEGKKAWNELINHCSNAESKLKADQTFLKQKMNHYLCKASISVKNPDPDKVIGYCTKAIDLDARDGQSYGHRAEAYILQEKYQEAVHDYSKAIEIEPGNQSFAQGKQKAENLLKQSQSVDYYKILGVKRTASQEDIKRAYRALAKEWHPDKYKGEDAEKAQKKMAQINTAYEILQDDDLRKKYDAGEDPNNPQQGQGQGQHFHGGFPGNFFFNGGGGGGGGFRFNFG